VSRIILCLFVSNAHGLILTDTFKSPKASAGTQLDLSSTSTPSIISPNHDDFVIGTAALSQHPNPLELLDEGYARGFNRFDIARTYGGGKSEEIVGNWIKSRDIDPASLKIVTKGGMGEDKYGDPNRPILTRKQLRNEMKTSLKTLGVDKVNLYMYHRDDPRIPVSDMVLWMNEFVSENKTHRWGVSNWSFARFQEATFYALENGYMPPSANSPQFSLACPSCEIWPTTYSISDVEKKEDQLKWYGENNVELICWEVLAKGFMAVPNLWEKEKVHLKEEHEYEVGSNEWRMFRIQRAYCNEENYRRRKVACNLAESSGLSLAQIAMLYPLSTSRDTKISVIAGVDRPQHFDDMAVLKDLRLSPKEMNMLLGKHTEIDDFSVPDIDYIPYSSFGFPAAVSA